MVGDCGNCSSAWATGWDWIARDSIPTSKQKRSATSVGRGNIRDSKRYRTCQRQVKDRSKRKLAQHALCANRKKKISFIIVGKPKKTVLVSYKQQQQPTPGVYVGKRDPPPPLHTRNNSKNRNPLKITKYLPCHMLKSRTLRVLYIPPSPQQCCST